MRNDKEVSVDQERNPYTCIYDRSCVEARISAKNEMKIEVILTSGLYKLMIIEEISETYDTTDNELDKKFLTI